MPSYHMNELRTGLKILVDGEPCTIVNLDFVKPGKGQAFTRVKYRNLLNDRVNEKTCKQSDYLEGADVIETDMQYLYSDGETWHFMVPDTFEQHEAGKRTMADAAQWIKEQDVCLVTLYNGTPISVTPPNFVILEVTQTDPGVKGDTSSGGNKPATLETGAVVKVPLFVQEGETLKIDTRTGEYVSRASKD